MKVQMNMHAQMNEITIAQVRKGVKEQKNSKRAGGNHFREVTEQPFAGAERLTSTTSRKSKRMQLLYGNCSFSQLISVNTHGVMRRTWLG